MNEFLNWFDKQDYMHSDHKVGHMLKTLIKKEHPFGYLLLDLHPKSSDDRHILRH